MTPTASNATSKPILQFAQQRAYVNSIGKWTSRDPAGYVDGLSLLQLLVSNPVRHLDPSGLAIIGDKNPKNCPATTDTETQSLIAGNKEYRIGITSSPIPGQSKVVFDGGCKKYTKKADIHDTFLTTFYKLWDCDYKANLTIELQERNSGTNDKWSSLGSPEGCRYWTGTSDCSGSGPDWDSEGDGLSSDWWNAWFFEMFGTDEPDNGDPPSDGDTKGDTSLHLTAGCGRNAHWSYSATSGTGSVKTTINLKCKSCPL